MPGAAAIPAVAGWWALAGIAVGEVIGSIFAGLAASVDGGTHAALTTFVGEVGLWAGMLGAVVVVSRAYGTGSVVEDFGLKFRVVDLAVGLAVGAGGLALSAVVAAATAGTALAGSNDQVLSRHPAGSAGFVLVAVVVAAGAPLVEELFFRGLLRQALAARFGAVPAIWGQAALFGLAHYQPGAGVSNLTIVVVIAGLGVLLGYAAQRTGRLAGGMLGHALFNLAAVVELAA